MALLTPSQVSTDRFTYNARDKRFSAEISDLGRGFTFGRVYDDACDVGLTLVSARTGRTMVFSVLDEERDREGELQCWVLRSVQGASGALGEYSMTLYND